MRFQSEGPLHPVNLDMSLTASADGLGFGDAKEDRFAARLADPFRSSANAHTLASTGATGGDLWGQRARWVAATCTAASEWLATVGILEDPRSAGHPTRWHLRPYGLVAANPFANGAFPKVPWDDEPATVGRHGSVRLRHRTVVAPAALSFAEVGGLWAEYARSGTLPPDADSLLP